MSFMDRGTVYNKDLYKKARELADKNGIANQTKTVVAGGNDAAAIHKAAGGIKTLEDAEAFLALGADRLGTSRIVRIAKSGNAGNSSY